MGYIVTLGSSDYDEVMDLTLGIKKMACKIIKCLEEAEEDSDSEDYEDELDYRGRPRYRNDGGIENVPSHGNSSGSMMGSTNMKRSRNGYARMRRKRQIDPMDWY